LIYKYHPALLATIVNWRPDIGRIVAVLVIAKAPYYCLKWFNDYAFAPSISVQAIAIAYLIASLILVPHGVFYWILNHPLVAGIGVISYSLYIWQQVFLFPASSAPTSIFWQRWPANLLCAGIIAVCSYYFIETPMRQLKNRPSRRTAGNAIAALP
jgi:peptidoglycan/LPS O-acetylase OafA/YrhL